MDRSRTNFAWYVECLTGRVGVYVIQFVDSVFTDYTAQTLVLFASSQLITRPRYELFLASLVFVAIGSPFVA